MKTVHIHVASSLQDRQGCWAYVLEEGGNCREFSGVIPSQDETYLALLGLLNALQRITHEPSSTQILIQTTSPQLCDGVARDMDRWKQRQWRQLDGRRVPHEAIWKRIYKLMCRFDGSVTLNQKPDFKSMLARALHLAKVQGTEPGHISIYVDGSFYPQNNVAGWGAVIQDGSEVRSFSGAFPAEDNNFAELIAAVSSLEQVGREKPVILYTDSECVAKGVMHLPEWKSNGWRHAVSGEKVKYRLIWSRLDNLLSSRPVRVEWVRGHSGVSGNVQADLLAGRAARNEIRRLSMI